MNDNDQPDLIRLLTSFLASGKLDAGSVMPVLQKLTRDAAESASIAELLAALHQHDGVEFTRLAEHVHQKRVQEAQRFHRLHKHNEAAWNDFQLLRGDLPENLPVGWQTNHEPLEELKALVRLVRDRRHVSERSGIAPETARVLGEKHASAVEKGLSLPAAWHNEVPLFLIQGLLSQLDDSRPELAESLRQLANDLQEDTRGTAIGDSPAAIAARVRETTDPATKRKLLDELCCHQAIAAARHVEALVKEPDEQQRAELILTCRFGRPSLAGWVGWKNWLTRSETQRRNELQALEKMLHQDSGELFLIWYAQQPQADPVVMQQVEDWCREHPARVIPERLVERWSDVIPPAEWNALTGVVVEDVTPEVEPEVTATPTVTNVSAAHGEPIPAVRPNARAAPVSQPQPPPPKVETPAAPPGPSLWNDHLQPFFAEQWYMVAGLMMVLAGSSLLAYYTWDKHWLVRYTLMPAMLGLFTAALAWLASWIERRDAQFASTAAMLRGAAIGLLPINFMAVALLSQDDQVSGKSIVVPLMSAAYLGVFGYGLNRWCKAVHPALGWLLGGTLLLLNSLVMLAPLSTTLADFADSALLIVVGIGFHLGFLVLAAAVVRFTRHVMTPDLAADQRVPWFFGSTLVITFVQVFAWVHGYLRHLPEVFTYGPMLVLTGGLVLLVERSGRMNAAALASIAGSGNEPRNTNPPSAVSDPHGEESFLGFAVILLGVLMGSSESYLRIVCFLLAGIVWLWQAVARRNVIHEWIGLTFLMLAGASIGLLDAFPKQWLAALGLGISGTLAVAAPVARRWGHRRLADSCTGMHVTTLLLTVIVGVLTQWHYRTPPLATGVCLLLIVGFFAWRAFRDDELKWVHTAMAVLAVSLMYLGCVDMNGRTLHGNTMVFGLAVTSTFWLLLNVLVPHRLVREARSTVLWVYGALAVAGMVLRVVVEGSTPGDALWYRQWMDYSGPLLMSAVLVFATWYSRSLIPAGMAALIVIILFPELKANFQNAFSQIGWGSGLGSSMSALGLMLLCFPLQRAAFLKDLPEGDRFAGQSLFPLRRYDHSLFTLPILASVLFLVIKTDTWTLVSHWLTNGVGWKTSLAVGATSITWTLLAAYNRKHSLAAMATYAACMSLLIGVHSGYYSVGDSHHWAWPLLITGVVLQMAWFRFRQLQPQHEWSERVLAKPVRTVLEAGAPLLAVLCMFMLLEGRREPPFVWLLLFVGLQLLWHGLATKHKLYGSLLFALTWLSVLTWSIPGDDELWSRLSVQNGLMPTLWLLLGFHVAHLLLEFRPSAYERLQPVSLPFLAATTVISLILVGVGVLDAFTEFQATTSQHVLLMTVAALTARTHACSLVVVPLLLLGWIALHRTPLLEIRGGSAEVAFDRLQYLSRPARLAVLSVFVAVTGLVGSWLAGRSSRILSSPFGFRWMRCSHALTVSGPAMLLAMLAALLHIAVPEFREDRTQLWAAYLAAATFAVSRRSWWATFCDVAAVVLLTVGNVHLIRVLFGVRLRELGLSELHLIGLGTALTLLMGTAVRFAVRRKAVTVFVNQASLALAGLILGLLAANYFAHPDLSQIPWLRFVVSGSMAYLAGLYFRRAARRPGPGEADHTDLCEGVYHFGVTVAIWCGVLLVPALRSPAVALWALGIPIAYFYAHAETGMRSGKPMARQYRNSATALAFAVLSCYVFRIGFQMLLFPNEPVLRTEHYHNNAPLIIVLSILMLRLHGLGGTSWLALYGGLALITGTYFVTTWPPRLSPFTHQIAAAWVAVAMGHFWTVASHQRSPVRTAVQRLGRIDGAQWSELRHAWGLCLLVGTQISVLFGLLDFAAHPRMVAPLLLGAASILIHQGIIRSSATYLGVAGVQIFLALHADFVVDSYLPKEHVIHVILAAWAVLLLVHCFASAKIRMPNMGVPSAGLAALTMVHVFYHHPSSATGLWTVAAVGLLAALTPRQQLAASSGEERIAAGLVLMVPAWLAYFSQAELQTGGWHAVFRTWPVLCCATAVFFTGTLAATFRNRWHTTWDRIERTQPRLFDQTLSLLGTFGNDINSATLWATFTLTVAAQVVHYGSAFETRTLLLLMSLYAASAVAFSFEGRRRSTMSAYVALQLCVLGFFAVARRQLMLTTEAWTPEYDVWASLVVSFGLTGAKQLLDRQDREIRIPLMGTLLTLPVVALIWTVYNNMGTDVTLLIVGLHSLMFTFMGRHDKESPYHLVAVTGFVAFVLISFWSKLELRVIHAYTLPVGMGVLVLLQLFRDQMIPETRNRIRLVTLLTMVSSTSYYALADLRYPLVFNLTLIGVSLGAMALGSFFRIRLYVAIGFAGLMVDLLSIVFRVLVDMDRGARMTIVGGLVLLIGVGLVFGAVYYKTNRDRIDARLKRWRMKFGEWE